MKLKNYRCDQCLKDVEEYFTSCEWEALKEKDKHLMLGKCECGGTLKLFNVKNNKQVWKFNG